MQYTRLTKAAKKQFPQYGYPDLSNVNCYILNKTNNGHGKTFLYHIMAIDLGYPKEWLELIFQGGGPDGITLP